MTAKRTDANESNLLDKKTPIFIPEFLFCADLSLRQPGFALLHLEDNGRIRVVDTSVCDNKKYQGTHGDMLVRIFTHMKNVVKAIPEGSRVTFVRERAFSRFATETQTLNKVVGITDFLIARDFSCLKLDIYPKEWCEIAPKSIKAIIAGSGNATKDDVREALRDYVGVYEYGSTDESDAVAAGVAYVIQENIGRPFRTELGGMRRMPTASVKKPKRKVAKPKVDKI